MKNKLDDRTAYFIRNLLQTFFTAIVAVILFSFVDLGGFTQFDINQGLGITGFWAIIILCFKTAMDFTNVAYPNKDERK